jgi:hypothetical protein
MSRIVIDISIYHRHKPTGENDIHYLDLLSIIRLQNNTSLLAKSPQDFIKVCSYSYFSCHTQFVGAIQGPSHFVVLSTRQVPSSELI